MAGLVAFVGREPELSRLLGALAGDAWLVLVTGDAGVGKTRFVGEGMARAGAGGMVAVRGECLPLSGTLPLLPVASALGELASLDDGRVLAAALDAAPGFARAEVGRLLPQLAAGAGEPGAAERGEGWRRERLFAGVAELLAAVGRGSRSGLGLVVEDVHWADSETLDFLTFLGRAGRAGVVRVVVTCRGDEVPLKPQVADWLAQARSAAGAEEVTLGPLSRAEAAEQVAALAGGPVPPGVVEAAGHWQAAGRPAEELPARVAAGRAAERVFGYAEAAGHWLRAIELCQAVPDAASAAGIGVPQLHVRAIDALDLSGEGVCAGRVAEDAYRRFADHPDPATAAVICQRAAHFRAIDTPAAGLPLINQALRLFGRAPPSAEQAEAWFDYANLFLRSAQGRLGGHRSALTRALEIAEAAGATTLIPRVLGSLALDALLRGQVEQGLGFLQRGQALAQAAGDGPALVWLAVNDSGAHLKLAKFQTAADVAVRGLEAAGETGLAGSWTATVLAANAAAALLALGRTDEAAALVGPLTSGTPERDHWVAHVMRAEIDLLRGDTGAAESRRRLLEAITARIGSVDFARESAQRAAELAVWAGLVTPWLKSSGCCHCSLSRT